MKSFNQYLIEAQEQHSVFDSIVRNVLQPPVFFTPTVMRRLDYEKAGFHAFHATDEKGIIGLAKIQGSKSKQISTMSPNSDTAGLYKGLIGGIETKGGILTVLEGSVSVRMNMDIFTGLTVGGRRTVLIGYSSDFGQQVTSQISSNNPKLPPLLDKLNTELREIIFTSAKKVLSPALKEFAKFQETDNEKFYDHLQEVIRKLDFGDTDHRIYSGDDTLVRQRSGYQLGIADLIRLAKNRKNRPGYKILTAAAGRFVKEYMDGMEKVLTRNKEYKELFVSDPTTENTGLYDEYILHNFKIKKVFVYVPKLSGASSTVDDFENTVGVNMPKVISDFEDRMKKAGIDRKLIQYILHTDADYGTFVATIKPEQKRLKSLNDKLK